MNKIYIILTGGITDSHLCVCSTPKSDIAESLSQYDLTC